jgi:hypothetical protein
MGDPQDYQTQEKNYEADTRQLALGGQPAPENLTDLFSEG